MRARDCFPRRVSKIKENPGEKQHNLRFRGETMETSPPASSEGFPPRWQAPLRRPQSVLDTAAFSVSRGERTRSSEDTPVSATDNCRLWENVLNPMLRKSHKVFWVMRSKGREIKKIPCKNKVWHYRKFNLILKTNKDVFVILIIVICFQSNPSWC